MVYANTTQTFCPTLMETPTLISMGKEDEHPLNMLRSPHRHDHLEILLIRGGMGVHTSEGQEYYTTAGDIMINNAGRVHARTSGDRIELFSCFADHVQLPGLPRNMLVPEGYSPVIFGIPDFSSLLELNRLMYQHTINGDPEGVEIANYLLRAYLVRLHQAVLEQGPLYTAPEDTDKKQLAIEIKACLDRNYLEEDLSLGQVAEELHVSSWHLAHVFKTMYKISPMRYVTLRRIGDAQTWLENTDQTVTEIAMRAGFGSASQFHHTFQKVTGTSPGHYRKSRE
ncbi:MAG: AraC family transcriptional regulator [Blautia sp.]|nr:AraC family transcriptional regulator [Blautia sp.]